MQVETIITPNVPRLDKVSVISNSGSSKNKEISYVIEAYGEPVYSSKYKNGVVRSQRIRFIQNGSTLSVFDPLTFEISTTSVNFSSDKSLVAFKSYGYESSHGYVIDLITGRNIIATVFPNPISDYSDVVWLPNEQGFILSTSQNGFDGSGETAIYIAKTNNEAQGFKITKMSEQPFIKDFDGAAQGELYFADVKILNNGLLFFTVRNGSRGKAVDYLYDLEKEKLL